MGFKLLADLVCHKNIILGFRCQAEHQRARFITCTGTPTRNVLVSEISLLVADT
jgi:hypothetical protein